MDLVLQAMSEIMTELGINYDYLELKKSLSYPYVIGEFYENDYEYETDGTEGEFLLTLWDKNVSAINIIELNKKIKNKLKEIRINKDGTAIFFHYSSSLPVLQDIDNLKKQEVRIDVKYYGKGD